MSPFCVCSLNVFILCTTRQLLTHSMIFHRSMIETVAHNFRVFWCFLIIERIFDLCLFSNFSPPKYLSYNLLSIFITKCSRAAPRHTAAFHCIFNFITLVKSHDWSFEFLITVLKQYFIWRCCVPPKWILQSGSKIYQNWCHN